MCCNKTSSQFSHFVNIYIFGSELKLGFQGTTNLDFFVFNIALLIYSKSCLYKGYKILLYKIINKYIRLVEWACAWKEIVKMEALNCFEK